MTQKLSIMSRDELTKMPNQRKVPYVLVPRFVRFINERIERLENRKKANDTSRGRLIDIRNLASAGLPITDPPKFVSRYLHDMVKELDDHAVWKEYELAEI